MAPVQGLVGPSAIDDARSEISFRTVAHIWAIWLSAG
jgi:hypothetical protein